MKQRTILTSESIGTDKNTKAESMITVKPDTKQVTIPISFVLHAQPIDTGFLVLVTPILKNVNTLKYGVNIMVRLFMQLGSEGQYEMINQVTTQIKLIKQKPCITQEYYCEPIPFVLDYAVEIGTIFQARGIAQYIYS
ncbi:MAG: hypothetical protein ATN35_08605 [Epulopiscium sp. Nele67-Bin004]|nr:MAG: hypothetical protein ATN35_08605 [Epulopiscium sp. Nele67-Bin004]